MANVLIERDTMTAIADSIRGYYGETKIGLVPGETIKKISKTPNVTDLDNYTIGYGESKKLWDRVTIPGAVKIRVNLYYWTEDVDYDFIVVASGSYADYTYPPFDYKFGGNVNGTWGNTTLEFEGNIVTFYFYSGYSDANYPGYYAEVTGIDADGNVITEAVEAEVANTYKPAEMPAAISGIYGGGSGVKMPDIIANGFNATSTTQHGAIAVFDVTNYNKLTFKYTLTNAETSSYQTQFTLVVSPGYRMKCENPAYGTWETYEQVDDDNEAMHDTVLGNSKTSVANVEKTYDLTGITSLVIRISHRRYSTYAEGCLRVHDIVLSY